ncbi:formin-like protein 3 isoform X1 [Juglans regia]|uniref:Formin-like protein 3 isoform X1 n=1 Tax=Juglans regia TaxID=51240 RepID=A0A2I4F704_JUGRE|nr:formin-like protein 3 isoform X1 [Juglans regia]
MSITGIQGHLLEVTVVACDKLKDTEWVSKQDPYVCLEYGGTKFRTRTCTDGHTDPVFQEKFPFPLIEGLTELTCEVWNSNTILPHTFIGRANRILLRRVLSRGFDDSAWPFQDKNGRYAGQVRLILCYENNVLKPATSSFAHLSSSSSCRPSVTQPIFQDLHWCSPATAANPYPTPAPAAPYAPPARPYPPPSDPYSSYSISNAAGYQPFPYSAPPSAVYPPPPIYPLNSVYPPSPYPPAPQSSHSLYPPGTRSYQGTYPPPPF